MTKTSGFVTMISCNCLDSLGNSVGGDNRDRTDDLLHAMQARQKNHSNLSSNTLNFQLAANLFTRFTRFTWFHKSIGGNLGEAHLTLPTFGQKKLTYIIALSRTKFKSKSLFNQTSRQHHDISSGEDNGKNSHGQTAILD